MVLAVPSVAQNHQKATTAAALVKEPNGLKIGSLTVGVSYPTGKAAGTHIEVTVEGWLRSSAVQAANREGFDLSVSAGGGAGLRAAPDGAIVARVQEGTLLSRAGSRGKWVKVKRTGYVLRTTFGASEPAKSTVAAAKPSPAQPPPPGPTAKGPAVQTTAAPTTAAPTTAAPVIAKPGRDTVRPRNDAPASDSVSGMALIKGGTVLSSVPDGKPVFTAESATDAEVVGRARDWIKVRIEGWVRTADITAEAQAGPRITGAMVREKPDKFVGQTVTWRLQFLAVQQADALRPEMPAGQPYVLTRGPLPESGFVYLMMTKEQVEEFRRLAPLDEVRVEAVVRTGRTRYLPIPVLELVKVVAQ